MDMVSIIARVAGGFAVKAAAIGGAIYGAVTIYAYVSHVFDGVSHAL